MEMPDGYTDRFKQIITDHKPGMVSDEDYLLFLALVGFIDYLNLGEHSVTEEEAAYLTGLRYRLAARALGADLVTMEELLDEAEGLEA